MVRHARLHPAVAGKLGQHDADRPAVRNAEAHDRRAEQRRRALRADVEAVRCGDAGDHRGVAFDGNQHLVRDERAGNGGRSNNRRRGGERACRRRWSGRGDVSGGRVFGRRLRNRVGGLSRSGRFLSRAGDGRGKQVDDQVGKDDGIGIGRRGVLAEHTVRTACRLPPQAVEVFLREVRIVGLRERGKGGDENRRPYRRSYWPDRR